MKCNNGHFDKDIRSSGITTVDADFQVFSSDIEDEDNRTEFNNQKFGITALKTIGGLRSLKVSNALFDNCQYGIRSEMATNDFIENNLFLVQDDLEHGDPINSLGSLNSRYGLYEVNSIRYSIANNTFTSKSGSGFNALYTYGAVLRGQATFETGFGDVKYNTFENVRRATQTEYHNWWTQLRCNNYNNGIDQEWLINPQSTWGVLNDQGTNCDLISGIRAGNTFTNETNAIKDYSETGWTYWASGDAGANPSILFTRSGSFVYPCGNLGDGSCTVSSDGGDPHLVYQLPMWDAKANLSVLQPELSTITANLDSGNTDTLLAHIAYSYYSNSALATELQSNGLLSDTVLLAITSRSPSLTENTYTAIVVQNAPLSNKVWKQVNEKMEDFKQENKDTIRYSQAFNTRRTVQQVKWEIQANKTTWLQAAGGLIGLYAIADSAHEMHDTIFSLLKDTLATKPFLKLAVGYSIEVDNPANARAILDTMQLENAADSSFYNYYDMATNLAVDSLTWFGLDSSQMAKIREISLSDFDEAILAQAVLSLVADSFFIRTPEPMPEDSANYRMEQHNEQPHTDQTDDKQQVKVYPNPFNNSFIVNYLLSDKAAFVEIEVTNLLGQGIKRYTEQNTQEGSKPIDIGPCNGMYLVRVKADGKIIHQSKQACLGN